jgi:YihY family inner membrane protein
MGRLRRLARALSRSLPGRVVAKFLEDRGTWHAIVLAWNLLFSLFPIALVAAGVLGLLIRGEEPATVYAQVVRFIPDVNSQDAALRALEGVKQQTGLLLAVGLAGLAWSGTALFGAMDEMFALIYRARPRGFLRQKVMSLAMMLLFTLLTALATSTSFLSTLIRDLPVVPRLLHNVWLDNLVGALAAVVLFGAIYTVVPNVRLSPRGALPGAILAGGAFKLLTLLFPYFLMFNRGLNQYGQTFTLLFVLLTFFYFVGLITILGVELNSVLALGGKEAREPDSAPGAERASPLDAHTGPWTGGSAKEPRQARRRRAPRPSRP